MSVSPDRHYLFLFITAQLRDHEILLDLVSKSLSLYEP